ncbi:sulfatase [Persicobacter diffluens]|uniref:Sulfatase n=2 Tax=Persicobacter diffluens TaxID=981 RepID=A0AAN4W3S1_9BACT|nr:sulfatase [Persicobacter diffluens]
MPISRAQNRPNVLFILVDDLGYHDLSFTGSSCYETPNIDQLASASVNFTQGYANCQVCSPSRASIMTGKFPARHGITEWIGAKEGEAWRTEGRHTKRLPATYAKGLSTSEFTIAEAFREEGYTTFFAGKWHIGDHGSLPEDHGFDINKGGYESGSPKGGYFSPFKNPALEDHQAGENLSFRLAKETGDFIQNQADIGKPFFAFLSFYAVHSPIQTDRDTWAKYRNKIEQKGVSPKGFEMGERKPIRLHQDNPVYAGLVEHMDQAVGHVLKALEESGTSDNTIVVFTSDNGGVVAGDSFSTSNAPLRAGKGFEFEGGIRVPFFIKLPNREFAQLKVNYPVIGSDFYPTLLALTGGKKYPSQYLDGKDLSPLFNGGNVEERPLIWHYPHYSNQGGAPASMIRLGNWKLIYDYDHEKSSLYHLANDVGEQFDLSAAYPEKREALLVMMKEYLDAVGAQEPPIDQQYDAKKEEAYLKKLELRLLPKVEEIRKEQQRIDYEPNADWWGSMLTYD